ncbi:MAG: hypothetical protein IJE07_07690 [Clostridia bacterium]|nr:hypothetical protein [Clostridia bacterium]
MLEDHCCEISQAYLLLCGAAYLLEEYAPKVVPELRKLPDGSACHVITGVMDAVQEARCLLRGVVEAASEPG